MQTLFKCFFVAVLFCFANSTATAQNDQPTHYHVIDYMKVKPGMNDDYVKCEQAWKKIHAAKKKAGKLEDWSLYQVISPSGADAEYDYVTRNTFVGEDKLAALYENSYFPDNWTSLLTPDEIDLVMRTSEFRTIVKTEVWATAESIWASDMSDTNISVFNYFSYPEGKGRADHFRVERDIWMPVHQARINDGKLKGWVLTSMVMPAGSSMPYHDGTVDLYKDMKSMLTDPVEDYFSKLYPGKEDALFDDTAANADLVRREVRMHVDGL